MFDLRIQAPEGVTVYQLKDGTPLTEHVKVVTWNRWLKEVDQMAIYAVAERLVDAGFYAP